MIALVFLTIVIGCTSSTEDASTTNIQSEQIQGEATTPDEDSDQEADIPNFEIISTTVAITEIMDALELDLIGIPESYKELPARYEGVTVVGNVKKPDLEIIKWLNPSDLLSVSTLEYDLKPVFEEAGIEASFLNLNTVQEMQTTILELGDRFSREEQAEKIVNEINQKKAVVEATIAGKESPTVLILFGVPGSYTVATEHSYIGNLVKLSGGINVIEDPAVEYVSANTEFLQQANPDIILRAAHGTPDAVVEMFDKEFKENDIWKHFNAVKNDRVFDLEESLFGTTGNLAATEALDELMKMLYE